MIPRYTTDDDDSQVHDRRVLRYTTSCTYRRHNDSYRNQAGLAQFNNILKHNPISYYARLAQFNPFLAQTTPEIQLRLENKSCLTQ